MQFIEWNVRRYECIVVKFDSLDEQDSYQKEMSKKGYSCTIYPSVYNENVWFFSKIKNFDLIKYGEDTHCDCGTIGAHAE